MMSARILLIQGTRQLVGHVDNKLLRHATLGQGQDVKFTQRCMSLLRLLTVVLLVLLSLCRSNLICDDRPDFHGGFVFNREVELISGRLMMIFNHTSDNNVVIPYVLGEVRPDKRYILWNIRFLLLWSGESTRYEYRGYKTNIK